MAGKTGLYQKTIGGVWYTKRGIPFEVRDRLFSERWRGKAQFVASTGEHHLGRAELKAKELWAAWGREIAQVRALGDRTALTAVDVSRAIQTWRAAQCTAAAGLPWLRDSAMRAGTLHPILSDDPSAVIDGVYSAFVGFDGNTRQHDETYFERHPDAPRSLDMDATTGMLIAQLQRAARDGGTWADLPGSQDDFLHVLEMVGLEGVVPASVADAVFQEFALAYLGSGLIARIAL